MDNETTLPTHECCWHNAPGSMTTVYYPTGQVTGGREVCCHCGVVRDIKPPVPPGHGPFFPQPVWPYWGTYTTGGSLRRNCPCRTENGGSGVCNCVLGSPTITY